MSPKWKSHVISYPDQNQVTNPKVVTVPCSGWYGLCFHADGSCLCVYEASIVSKNGTDSLNLPQRTGDNAVSSLQIGTLLYLERCSTVTVSHKSLCELHYNGGQCFEWLLMLQREADTASRGKSASEKSLMCATCYRLFASSRSIQLHIEATHRVSDPSSIWNLPLKVVYEDKFLAVVDKPQGMTVMGDRQSLCRSDLLLAHAGNGDDALNKPVPTHRLDAPTGGLLVIAKTKICESKVKSSFAGGSCRKRYLALALGRIEPPGGTIEVPVSGKPAVTHYRVLNYTRSVDKMTNGWVTTVELHPATGRKHQLRRHLKHLGHPIWGDKRYAPYGKANETAMNQADVIHSTNVEHDSHIRLCLWAMEVSFPHPDTGRDLTVSLHSQPQWLTSLLAYQEQRVKQEQDKS